MVLKFSRKIIDVSPSLIGEFVARDYVSVSAGVNFFEANHAFTLGRLRKIMVKTPRAMPNGKLAQWIADTTMQKVQFFPCASHLH